MSLLIDSNLSSALCQKLGDLYPESKHVREFDLQNADDRVIWEFARERGLTIVSKDSDFQHLSLLLGYPPKVVWVRLGNCTTTKVERLLRMSAETIKEFLLDSEASLLILPAQTLY